MINDIILFVLYGNLWHPAALIIYLWEEKKSLLLSLCRGNELQVRHDFISFQHSQLLHSLLPQQVPWPNLEALPAHGCVDGITEAWMGGLEEEGEERRDVRLRYGQSLGGLVRKGQGGTEGMVWMHNLLAANEQSLFFLIIFNFLNWYLASLCSIDTFHMWHTVHHLELVLVSLRCWELRTWPSQSSFFNLMRIQISSAFLKDLGQKCLHITCNTECAPHCCQRTVTCTEDSTDWHVDIVLVTAWFTSLCYWSTITERHATYFPILGVE